MTENIEALADDLGSDAQDGEESLDEALPEPQSDDSSFVLKQELPFILEAMVFASPEPLTTNVVKEALERQGREITAKEIDAGFETLVERWQNPERPLGMGLEIAQVAGGYVFRTRTQYGPFVRSLFHEKPQRLSNSQLEVLSIISYRQPVTRVEVEDIRGVDCSGSMRRLLGLKLIKILGKSEGVGRPLLYGTTKQFLEFFGFNSLHDLPTLKEYQELNKDAVVKPAEGDEGPITVRDLFADNASMFSDETERLSNEALDSLEAAMGVVQETASEIDVEKILNPQGAESE